VVFPGMVPSIYLSAGTGTYNLRTDTDGAVSTERTLVDKNAVVLNPHSFGSMNPQDIRDNVSETRRKSVLKKRAEQQRQRRALKSANERAAINELRRTRVLSEEQLRIINARRRDKYHESSHEERTANYEKRRQRREEVASTLRKTLYFTSP
jgi:hypothetical protein